MIEYVLLDNGVAVISNREKVNVQDKLVIRFHGATEDCQAIFDIGDHQFYRAIKDELCYTEAGILDGVIKVTVVKYDGRSSPDTWMGEELKANRTFDHVEVAPNDADIYRLICELRLENSKIRAANKAFREEIKRLDEKITNLMEGYDLA